MEASIRLTNRFNLPAPIVRAGKLPKTISYHMTFEERFMASIQFEQMSGCWLWERAMFRDGYGKVDYEGKQARATRASYMHFVGPIPDGHFVLHKCDTPLCVRPDHLFTGTQKQNIADMFAKGRQHDRRGEKQGQSKLTEAQVREIKSLKGKVGPTELGRRYGVNHSAICAIYAGKTWSHVE